MPGVTVTSATVVLRYFCVTHVSLDELCYFAIWKSTNETVETGSVSTFKEAGSNESAKYTLSVPVRAISVAVQWR